MFSHVSFVSVPVVNVARARDFYRDMFDLAVATDAPFFESRWVLLDVGDSRTQIHLDDRPGREVGAKRLALALIAEDIEATVEALRDRGVEIVQELQAAAWNSLVQYALVRDSEGNIVMIADG